MADTTNTEPKSLPENWNLPALEGSVSGVTAEIDRLPGPEHFKAALKSDIAAALDGTDHNFIKLHAHGTRHAEATFARHIILIDLETSKKNL